MRFSHHLFVWLLEVSGRLRRARGGFSHHLFVWLLEDQTDYDGAVYGSATICLCGYWKTGVLHAVDHFGSATICLCGYWKRLALRGF